MAYVINNTRGTAITTITDGTVDNTTSLQLFGKSYSGFGEGLNENLVKLLENSASTSAPSAPLQGELWFDTSTNQLKAYDGTSFKPTGGAKVSTTQPSSPSAGDLWQDSTNNQLYFYTGSAWLLVGPVYTTGQTLSGWVIETVNNSSGVSKVISSMYAGNVRVAVLSKEAFTPQAGSPSGTPLATNGFATVSAGLTLNSTLGASFSGNSTQASSIDVSSTSNTSASVIAGGNFLRSDASDTTTGAIIIDNNSGITIGDGQELTITASSGDITIAQTAEDKNLSFTINDGGSTKTPIAITGSTGAVAITGDTTITGNLTITGEFENSSSEINIVNDAFLKLNTGNSEADSGIIVETSDTDDARMFYDVSENQWVAGENATYSPIVRLADATTDGDANVSKALKVDGSGQVKVTTLTLGAVGSFLLTDTAVTTVPSTGAVATLMAAKQPLWDESAKTVSTSAPTSGDGSDGDFWFVREA
jgi:hypothetical protein